VETEKVRTALASGAALREAEVEFTDGEKVKGLISKSAPMAEGIFFDAYVSDQTAFTLYIIKEALRSIQYL
jgi:hypothetical protein